MMSYVSLFTSDFEVGSASSLSSPAQECYKFVFVGQINSI